MALQKEFLRTRAADGELRVYLGRVRAKKGETGSKGGEMGTGPIKSPPHARQALETFERHWLGWACLERLLGGGNQQGLKEEEEFSRREGGKGGFS